MRRFLAVEFTKYYYGHKYNSGVMGKTSNTQAVRTAHEDTATMSITSSSSSSSPPPYICHGVGPLVDSFRSHVSRNLFKGLP
jgi:hypothetical protein